LTLLLEAFSIDKKTYDRDALPSPISSGLPRRFAPRNDARFPDIVWREKQLFSFLLNRNKGGQRADEISCKTFPG